MTLPKFPGTLALGLLASLAAHWALYGGGHVVGGTQHELLLQIALASGLAFVALVGVVAWAQATNLTNAHAIAAHIRERLPSGGSVVVASAAWYVCIEAVEPRHISAPGIALLAAVAAASYAVLRLADAVTEGFAHAAIAISRTFSPRAPAWRSRPHARVCAHDLFFARRRFARPPPVAFAFHNT